MKEDYLWDKTGEDLEIKRLENKLQAFRYQKNVAPQIPVKVTSFKKSPPRKIFAFAITAAVACLIIGIFALSLWLQSSAHKTEVNNVIVQTTPAKSDVALPDATKPANPIDIKIKDTEPPKRINNHRFYRIRKTPAPSFVRPNVTMAKAFKTAKPEVQLTPEEKYAYTQLMTALSITSSKLKFVQDTVQEIEQQKSISKEGK